MTTLHETIGREALLALANQYSSISEALMELIDNPFDYRYGRELTVEVTIDKAGDTIRVLDHGGEGMNDHGLSDWIGWGVGHAHRDSDIGQYHVGGKLAAIYLAESIEILCRRFGEDDVWRFRDEQWGSRSTLYQGEPEVLAPGRHLGDIEVPEGVGFTCVTLRRLKNHRYEVPVLMSKLASTYRWLLDQGDCTIRINGEPVRALGIPLSAGFEPIVVPKTRLGGGVTVHGRVWVTDRERLPERRGVSLKAGIRTVFNGRTVTEGEEFGHYLGGRGTLQRLFGEIVIEHLKPNTTKTDWDRDSLAWGTIETFVHAQMSPLVADLNRLGDARPISREQRKRANRVRRRLEDVFRQLGEQGLAAGQILDGGTDAPGGRKPPVLSDELRIAANGRRERSEPRDRTPPPPDAVGRLLRRHQGGIPPIEFDQLGRASRSQWRHAEQGRSIVLNTDYPMYKSVGETDEYVFESALLQLLADDSELPYETAMAKFDDIVWLADG